MNSNCVISSWRYFLRRYCCRNNIVYFYEDIVVVITLCIFEKWEIVIFTKISKMRFCVAAKLGNPVYRTVSTFFDCVYTDVITCLTSDSFWLIHESCRIVTTSIYFLLLHVRRLNHSKFYFAYFVLPRFFPTFSRLLLVSTLNGKNTLAENYFRSLLTKVHVNVYI